MSRRIEIHPNRVAPRLIRQAVDALRESALLVMPTDSGYAFVWALGERAPQERVVRLRQLDEKHHFTVLCRDLKEIAQYAKVNDAAYRLMRALTPGPYTFILPGTKQLPRRLLHPRRRTVGIRVPDHPVAQALLEELQEPLLGSSLLLPDLDLAEVDHSDLMERIEAHVDWILDCGPGGHEPTTVLDLTGDIAEVVRMGRGPIPD